MGKCRPLPGVQGITVTANAGPVIPVSAISYVNDFIREMRT